MTQKLLAFVLGAAVAAAGCGDSPTSPSDGGRFFVRLTSSSFASGQAVLVTFSRVRATRAGGGTVDVPFRNGASSITCDLKKITSIEGDIAGGPVTPGQYTEVRLVIQSATLYLDNPSVDTACGASLRAPAGRSAAIAIASSDIVLSRSFEVAAASDVVMRLALNSEQSIRANGDGTYTMTPVVTIAGVG